MVNQVSGIALIQRRRENYPEDFCLNCGSKRKISENQDPYPVFNCFSNSDLMYTQISPMAIAIFPSGEFIQEFVLAGKERNKEIKKK